MYDEKFPAAIVKAQVDIINVFLVFASIAFIEGNAGFGSGLFLGWLLFGGDSDD